MAIGSFPLMPVFGGAEGFRDFKLLIRQGGTTATDKCTIQRFNHVSGGDRERCSGLVPTRSAVVKRSIYLRAVLHKITRRVCFLRADHQARAEVSLA